MADVNPVQIQKYLGGMDYPCSKSELMDHARDQGADENVLRTIQNLPYDRFNSPNDISEAVGRMD